MPSYPGSIELEPGCLCGFREYSPDSSNREYSQSLIIDGISQEIRHRLVSYLGTSTGVCFMTSKGIKRMEPGKRYDRNLNEILSEDWLPD